MKRDLDTMIHGLAADPPGLSETLSFARGTFGGWDDGGCARVRTGGAERVCDVLSTLADGSMLDVGDAVLLALAADGGRGVVLGRVGPRAAAAPATTLTLEASESLTLKCGESSVELRADGRVMVKGDDVLIRAKGTQRIRAGNVAIN